MESTHIKREQERRLQLDGVTYILNLANASPAMEMALSLTTLLQDLTVSMDKTGDVKELPVGKVLAQLGGAECRELRRFLIDYVNVAPEGTAKPYRFAERYDDHMNAYPSHYLPVLWASVQFQFGRFFRAGGAAASLLPAQLRSLFQQKAA